MAPAGSLVDPTSVAYLNPVASELPMQLIFFASDYDLKPQSGFRYATLLGSTDEAPDNMVFAWSAKYPAFHTW